MKNRICLYCGGKFNPVEADNENFCCLHCCNSHAMYGSLNDLREAMYGSLNDLREVLGDGALFIGTVDEWLDEVENNDN